MSFSEKRSKTERKLPLTSASCCGLSTFGMLRRSMAVLKNSFFWTVSTVTVKERKKSENAVHHVFNTESVWR